MISIRELLLSHSSMQLLHACARKFEFRKLYGMSNDEDNVPGEVGKALHIGEQSYLVHHDRERAIFDYMCAYPIHLCYEYNDPRSLEAGYATLEAMMDSSKLDAYELAHIKCVDGVTRPAVEVPFAINIKGFELVPGKAIPIIYRGFIDAIFHDKEEGGFAVWDIKTTKNDRPQDLSPRYYFSDQCIPYGLVLEHILNNPIEGFGVNYLCGFINILNPTVQVHKFHKSKSDIEDWFRGLLVDLTNIKMFLQMQWWPRTGGGNGCMGYNRRCQFFDICDYRDQDIIMKILSNEETHKELKMREYEGKGGSMHVDPWISFDVEVPG